MNAVKHLTLFCVFCLLSGMMMFHALPAVADDLPPPYPDLLAEAEELNALMTIMPVRIFNLGNRFAEAPDQELTARLADTVLTRADGKRGFTRRVGFTALRFIGRKDFTGVNLEAVVLRGMDDPVDWVRYDAVWAGEAAGLDTPAFRKKLAELARGLDPSEYDAVSSSDPTGQMRKRAGLLLRKLKKS